MLSVSTSAHSHPLSENPTDEYSQTTSAAVTVDHLPEDALEGEPHPTADPIQIPMFGMNPYQLINMSNHLNHLIDANVTSSTALYTPAQIFNLTIQGVCSILTFPYQTPRSQVIKLKHILTLPVLTYRQQRAFCQEEVVRAYTTDRNKYDAYVYLDLDEFLIEVEREVSVDSILVKAKLNKDRRMRYTLTLRGLSILSAIAYAMSIRNTLFDDFGEVAPIFFLLLFNTIFLDRLARLNTKTIRYLRKHVSAREVSLYQCRFDDLSVYYDQNSPVNNKSFFVSLIVEKIVPSVAFDRKVFTPVQLFNLQQPALQLALKYPWFIQLRDVLQLNRKITPKEAFLLSNHKLYQVGCGLPIFYTSWRYFLYDESSANFHIINSLTPEALAENVKYSIRHRRRLNFFTFVMCLVLSSITAVKCSQTKFGQHLNAFCYSFLSGLGAGFLYFSVWLLNAIVFQISKLTSKTSNQEYRTNLDSILDEASLYDHSSTYTLHSRGFFFSDKMVVDTQSPLTTVLVNPHSSLPPLLRIERPLSDPTP